MIFLCDSWGILLNFFNISLLGFKHGLHSDPVSFTFLGYLLGFLSGILNFVLSKMFHSWVLCDWIQKKMSLSLNISDVCSEFHYYSQFLIKSGNFIYANSIMRILVSVIFQHITSIFLGWKCWFWPIDSGNYSSWKMVNLNMALLSDTKDLKSVTVSFRIPYFTQWGHHLLVCGSEPVLGSWNVKKGLLLKPYHREGELIWSGSITVPVGFECEYSYYVVDEERNILRWEVGKRRKLLLPDGAQNGHLVELHDLWKVSLYTWIFNLLLSIF